MIVKVLSTEIFDIDTIVETAAMVRDICNLELHGGTSIGAVTIHFMHSLKDGVTLENCVDQFMDLLVTNSHRELVRRRTDSIRGLIVMQAFTEAEFDTDLTSRDALS